MYDPIIFEGEGVNWPRLEDPKIKSHVVDIALEIVNKIRIALAIGEGKLNNLPEGVIQDSKMCVIARALSNGWSADVSYGEICLATTDPEVSLDETQAALEKLGFEEITRYGGALGRQTVEFRTPTALSMVAKAFDEGLLPEYSIVEDDDYDDEDE
jgi:hypothetical protein